MAIFRPATCVVILLLYDEGVVDPRRVDSVSNWNSSTDELSLKFRSHWATFDFRALFRLFVDSDPHTATPVLFEFSCANSVRY